MPFSQCWRTQKVCARFISRSHLGRTCQKKHNDAVQMKAGAVAELLIASAGLARNKGSESICGVRQCHYNAAAPLAGEEA